MKTYRLIQALTLIFIVCSGVQGQYNGSTVGLSPATNQTQDAQYAQFYTMNTGSVPSTHVGAPENFEIAGNMPATVYFSNQMQPVPFSQYQSHPTYAGNNSLWIKGATAWSQYAKVPVGANVELLVISPTGGNGILKMMDANGLTYSNNYFFYPNSQITFYADAPGRHIITFVVGGMTSNPVVIDVAGTMTMTYNPTNPTGNYYPPLGNYPGYYQPYNDPQAALDNADANKAYQKWLTNSYNIPGMIYNGNDGLGGNNYIASPYNDNNYWNYGVYNWLNTP